MTEPLAHFLASVFGRPGLVLHGGTGVPERRGLVERFQREDGPPFFILSLKAGGTGLGTYSARLLARAQLGEVVFAVDDDKQSTTLIVTLPAAPQAAPREAVQLRQCGVEVEALHLLADLAQLARQRVERFDFDALHLLADLAQLARQRQARH
eukprot:gene24184-44869_t